MQRFHGTAARQLALIDESECRGAGVAGSQSLGVQTVARQSASLPRIRLMQKDMYAELTRRRRRAQIAARRWVDESRTPSRES